MGGQFTERMENKKCEDDVPKEWRSVIDRETWKEGEAYVDRKPDQSGC